MADVLDTLYNWLSSLPKIARSNILEITTITFLVYEMLTWIKTARIWMLLKDIVVIFVFTLFAYAFNLSTIQWILEKTALIAATTLVIIFQLELRKALEWLDNRDLLTDILSSNDGKTNLGFTEKTVNEPVRVTFEMVEMKTGTLIVIERGVSLKEIERTGIEIGDVVSGQLLASIFEHDTPLHDKVVVVRGDRIMAVTCYLSLFDSTAISKDLGTKHGAAMGTSESTNSVTTVVSEGIGRTSVVEDGVLTKINDADILHKRLSRLEKDE